MSNITTEDVIRLALASSIESPADFAAGFEVATLIADQRPELIPAMRKAVENVGGIPVDASIDKELILLGVK